jgi:hypothetical protein
MAAGPHAPKNSVTISVDPLSVMALDVVCAVLDIDEGGRVKRTVEIWILEI